MCYLCSPWLLKDTLSVWLIFSGLLCNYAKWHVNQSPLEMHSFSSWRAPWSTGGTRGMVVVCGYSVLSHGRRDPNTLLCVSWCIITPLFNTDHVTRIIKCILITTTCHSAFELFCSTSIFTSLISWNVCIVFIMQFICENEFLRAYNTQFMSCNTHVPHTTNPTQGVSQCVS